MTQKNETPDEILSRIHEHRPLSRARLYALFKELEIKPAAASQRPQRYPAGTADKILRHLGFIQQAEFIKIRQNGKVETIPLDPSPILSLETLRQMQRRTA